MKLNVNKTKIIVAGMLIFSVSVLQAACPVTCPTGVGSPRFCSLAVTGPLSAGSLCVQGNESVGGSLNICGSLSVSGTISPGSVIPYGANIVAGAGFGLAGADLGFGISQGLIAAGVDLLSYSMPRNGTLANLVLNVYSFTGIGSVTAEVYISGDAGVTWIPTGITVAFVTEGTYSDLVDIYPVLQTNLVALRLTPSVAGLAVGVSGGLVIE